MSVFHRFFTAITLNVSLLVALGLLTGETQAAEEVAVNRMYLNQSSSQLLTIKDAKYSYMLTNPNWGNVFNDEQLVNKVTLGLDHRRITTATPNIPVSVTFDVTATEWNGTAFVQQVYKNITLNVQYQLSGDYEAEDVFLFEGAYQYTVEITSSTGITDNDAVYLEAGVNTTRYYTYNMTYTPAADSITRVVNAKGELELSWPYARGAEAYDLEWCFVDLDNIAAPYTNVTYSFKENGARVRLTDNAYRMPVLYQSGVLLFRYRPVYYDYATGTANVEGNWGMAEAGLVSVPMALGQGNQTPYLLIDDTFNQTVNWAATSSFVEEGKSVHTVAIADGLGRNRQSQVSNREESQVIVTEPVYDSYGRPAVSVLPSPVNQYDFEHINGMNVPVGSPAGTNYNYNHFELESMVDATTCAYTFVKMSDTDSEGAAYYFSDKNTYKEGAQAFVPDADQVPFSIAKYTTDGTGRLREMGGGFGDEFQPVAGKSVRYLYDQPSNADLGDYFVANNHGDGSNYQSTHTVDQNGQRSTSYYNTQGQVVMNILSGGAPTGLEAVDGSSLNQPRTVDLTDYNYWEGNTLVATYAKIIDPGAQPYEIEYKVTVPQYQDLCDNGTQICFDCVYDISLYITIENPCDPTKFDTLFKNTITAGQFEPLNNTCEPTTLYEITGGTPLSISPGISRSTTLYINKRITPSESAARAYANHYIENSGCVETLESLFLDNLEEGSIANDCFRSPCELKCETQLGSFESYVTINHRVETTIYVTTVDSIAALDYYVQNIGTAGVFYDLDSPEFKNWLAQLAASPSGPDKDLFGTFESTQAVVEVTYDTTAATTAYNAAMQTCLQECEAGVLSSKTKCDELEEELTAAFKPGGLYADYDPMNGYAGISTYSIFSATNDFNNFVYTNLAIDYRQADGTPYASTAAGPWNLGQQQFIEQFEPQWAEAIYAHIKAAGDLPDQAICFLNTCASNQAVFEYDAYLSFANTYDQAALARTSLTQSYNLFQPNSTFGSTRYSFSQTPIHSTQAFNDPVFAITAIGTPLLNYLNGTTAPGNLDLYTIAHEATRGISGTTNAQIGLSDCYRDREWNLFRALYLAERNRLIDLHLYSCTPTDNIPFIWDDIMDANPQPIDVNNLTNPTNVQANYDNTYETICETNCADMADSWLASLGTCNATSATLTDLRADFIALCQESCNGYSLTGFSSLPAVQDIIYSGGIQVDVVNTEITINSPCSSGTTAVSSFEDIMNLYESCSLITFDIECNPYSISTMDPYRSVLDTNSLDQCGCNKITQARQDFDAKQLAGTLPEGVTFIDEYFAYEFDISIGSFAELECQCAIAAGSGFNAISVSVPEALTCAECTDCSTLLGEFESFYFALYGNTNYTIDEQTDEALFDLFSNYQKLQDGAHQFNGAELREFALECQNLADKTVNHYNLHPVTYDLLEFINDVYETTGFVNGTTYSLPLYHEYYLSELYPHPFALGIEVQVSISSTSTSVDIDLQSITGPTVLHNINIASIAPGGNTLADIYTLTSIGANFPAVTATGEVFNFQLTGVSNTGAAITLEGESDFAIYKRITQVNANSLEADKTCFNRYGPAKEIDPCIELAVTNALNSASAEFSQNIDSIRVAVDSAYLETCTAFQENFTMSYDANEYQATLYYYSLDGNLTQTVAPNGVTIGTPATHSFRTEYQYNAINQLVGSNTPDGGRTKNWYNEQGQLVLSQNAEQRVIKGTGVDAYAEYSYTRYDELNRIVEVGEVQAQVDYNGQIVANPTLEDLPADIQASIINRVPLTTDLTLSLGGTPVTVWDVKATKQVTYTYYSTDLSTTVADYFGGQPRYLLGRVASTTIEEEPDGNPATYDYGIHFAYDIHGNVATIINENTALRSIGQHLKTIQYEYDLLSGDVKEVLYQANQADAKYHRYRYDANNRLASVQTSSDHLIWEEDAHYEYYLHGPLARTELGEQKVQGLDYVYNLQGWIKAMNSNSLQEANDPGKDGLAGNSYYSSRPDLHEQIARDVFGYVVDYYNGDYTAIDGTKQTFAATHGGSFDYSLTGLVAQYNGNIAGYAPGITDVNNEVLDAYGRAYRYDQLYRLKKQQAHTVAGQLAGNTWAGATASNRYKAELTFDANGNITDLVRTGSGAGIAAMDDLHYDYNNAGTNQLTNVTDAIGVTHNSDFGAYQQLTSDPSASYTYNPMGQLISDSENEIANIEWHLNGKVAKITRTAASQQPDLEFQYDPFGNRTLKIVKPTANIGDWKFTYYANDASGKHMAVYENKFVPDGTYLSFTFNEDCEGAPVQLYIFFDDGTGNTSELNTQIECGIGDPQAELITYLNNQPGFSTSFNPTTNEFILIRTDEIEWEPGTSLEVCVGAKCYEILPELLTNYTLEHLVAERAIYGSERLGIDQATALLSKSLVFPSSGASSLNDFSVAKRTAYSSGSEVNLTFYGTGGVGYTDVVIKRANGTTVATVADASGTLDQIVTAFNNSFSSGTLSASINSQIPHTISIHPINETGVAEGLNVEYVATGDLWINAAQPEPFTQFNRTTHTVGLTAYELSNYLGNVSNTISNRALYGASGVVYEEDFSTDVFSGINDWSLSAGASSANGYARNIGTNAFMRKPLPVTVGQGYVVQFDLTTLGSYTVVNITDGNGSLGSYQLTSGTHMLPFTPTTASVTIEWANDATVSQQYRVDNILVQPNGRDLILAEVMQYQDYYPYGMLMPGRQGGTPTYRYGFQNQETDNEMAGNGNFVSYKYRMHDARLGRFFSVDPLAAKYPFYSTYAFSGNRVIDAIELEGLEPAIVSNNYNQNIVFGNQQTVDAVNNHPSFKLNTNWNAYNADNINDVKLKIESIKSQNISIRNVYIQSHGLSGKLMLDYGMSQTTFIASPFMIDESVINTYMEFKTMSEGEQNELLASSMYLEGQFEVLQNLEAVGNSIEDGGNLILGACFSGNCNQESGDLAKGLNKLFEGRINVVQNQDGTTINKKGEKFLDRLLSGSNFLKGWIKTNNEGTTKTNKDLMLNSNSEEPVSESNGG